MDIVDTLQMVTRKAQQEDDLPDFLAARILAIADQLPSGQLETGSIEKLIGQIELYDNYGQTGYLGMGVNHVILEKTISQIEEKLRLAT
jgi:hypothetical protein